MVRIVPLRLPRDVDRLLGRDPDRSVFGHGGGRGDGLARGDAERLPNGPIAGDETELGSDRERDVSAAHRGGEGANSGPAQVGDSPVADRGEAETGELEATVLAVDRGLEDGERDGGLVELLAERSRTWRRMDQ
jgi:hypothetical protein